VDFAAALDDDLNAPRAIAALFELVREGNRLLDEGIGAGPALAAAWELADRVLAVAPDSRTLTVGPEALPVEQEDGIPVRPPEVPPADPQGEEAWALRWAAVRLAEKRGRNYGEADRIRELLRRAGWEIRDRRDGQIEVLRSRGSI